jgi:hypothetical protein
MSQGSFLSTTTRLNRRVRLWSGNAIQLRRHLSERIPRPVTIRTCQLFAVTAARWMRAQVYFRVSLSWRRLGLWDLHADVQLEDVVLAQGTGAGFLRQSEGQHEECLPLPIGRTTSPCSFEMAWASQWTG